MQTTSAVGRSLFPLPLGVNGSRAVAVARLSAGQPRRPGPGVSRARLPVVSSIALPALRASGLGAAERPGFSGRRGSVLSPAGVGSNPELVSPVPHRTGHVGRGVAGGKKCRGGREIKRAGCSWARGASRVRIEAAGVGSRRGTVRRFSPSVPFAPSAPFPARVALYPGGFRPFSFPPLFPISTAAAPPVPSPTTTSDQTRRPAEFKHITKRRKRN